jgi:hypothetical protein
MPARKAPQPPPAPYAITYEDEDVYAIKALNRGNASEGQQQRALHWLVQRACMVDEVSYRPGSDGDRDTAFAEGRRYVGLQVLKLVNLNMEVLKRGNNAKS